MKDQIKIQVTSDKFQQDASFTGDQLRSHDHVSSESFKSADMPKKALSAGLQKRANPRLFIL